MFTCTLSYIQFGGADKSLKVNRAFWVEIFLLDAQNSPRSNSEHHISLRRLSKVGDVFFSNEFRTEALHSDT